jgi:hypothetical protein
MAVPSSGQLGLRADIALEIDGSATGSDVSLNTLSSQAGFSVPNGMFEFYGYVDAVAPTVSTNSATSVTYNSMVANGNVTSDGGGTITSRGFYFGTSSTYTSNTKYTVSGTTGSFSRSFTGLSQSTTYYITAFAVNSAGESVGATQSAATGYNYTFKTTDTLTYNTAATAYMSNPLGGWAFNWSVGFSSSYISRGCKPHCTNRQNRVPFGNNSASAPSYMFYEYNRSGCQGIGSSGQSLSSSCGGFVDFVNLRRGFHLGGSCSGNAYYNAS